MEIRTWPVFSRLADPESLPPELAARVPTGWRLSRHQVETYLALTRGDAEVIFNTALTGDGKSLAGQLPALVQGWRSPVLALYPTNELIGDQQRQLALASRHWRANLQYAQLNGPRLDEIMADDDYAQRGDAVLGVVRGNDVILSNPDIFHLIMHQFYVRPQDAPDRIIGPLLNRVGQFTFDEFHLFEAPQVVSVLNALLFMREVGGAARRHRSLFLSATPGDLMLEYLQRSGLEVRQIRGTYLHGEAPPSDDGWRPILQGATIHTVSGRAEEWVAAHLEDVVVPFFRKHGPGAKGAIIVNSVASAYRVLEQVRPALAAQGLRAEPNTGLTPRSRRAAAYAADLLVGTSTVDVGVDFQINLLIFESRDAGSFLQRLGRLGRHSGYERDGVFHPFHEFVAYAMVPPWVEEALLVGRDREAPLLRDGEAVDREQLGRAIEAAYPPAASFGAYARLWGGLQSARVISGLCHRTIRDQYVDVRANLGQRYEKTFGITLRTVFGRYRQLRDTQRALLEEAAAFRGRSHFSCCLVNETEAREPAADSLQVDDILHLLPQAELELLDEEMFYQLAARLGVKRRVFERHEPLAFFRLRGWRERREDQHVMLDADVREWGAHELGRAVARQGFMINAAVPGLSSLNNRLARRKVPAAICLGHHPVELKRRLRLPLLFGLHVLVSRDGAEGCVAFDRDALLLEVRLRETGFDSGGGAIIV